MIRNAIIFLITFAVGALLVLVIRSALHQPYAAPMADDEHHHNMPMPAAASSASGTTDPHGGHATHAESAEPTHQHADHTAPAATVPSATAQPVNTICAICGMDVDPDLPTTTFQGKVIGFACMKCPPKFAKDPAHFGPYYLRNEKLP